MNVTAIHPEVVEIFQSGLKTDGPTLPFTEPGFRDLGAST